MKKWIHCKDNIGDQLFGSIGEVLKNIHTIIESYGLDTQIIKETEYNGDDRYDEYFIEYSRLETDAEERNRILDEKEKANMAQKQKEIREKLKRDKKAKTLVELKAQKEKLDKQIKELEGNNNV